MTVYTKEQIGIIIRDSDPSQTPALLRYIFSQPENIALFGEVFFPDAVITAPAPFHYEVYEYLHSPDDGALAAPRGHAKSTITGQVYLICSLVNKWEDYIVYISQSHSKTIQFLEPVRHEMKNNKLLHWVYGRMDVHAAQTEDGRDREDCFDVMGVRVEAVSFEKNMRGFKYHNMRPTLIIGDDIEDDSRVINSDLRAKDSRKLNRVIIPSLDPVKGRFKMIGTILNAECLLLDKIKQYNGKIYRAIQEDGTLLMPDYWTMERLMKKKKSIGSASFAAEYMNDPVDSDSSLIKADWIRACFDDTISFGDETKYDEKYLGVDFAFSDRNTADNSAFVGVGVSEGTPRFTITQCTTRKGMTVIDQFDYIHYLWQRYKYDDCALEENSIHNISRDLDAFEFDYTLFWTAAQDSKAKLRPNAEDVVSYKGKRHTVGKKAMVLRLGTEFENKNIRIPYKTQEDKDIAHSILQECVSWALEGGKLVEIGIHPDIPIALGYALERANMEGAIIDF